MKKLVLLLSLGLLSCNKENHKFTVEVSNCPDAQAMTVMMKKDQSSSDVALYDGPVVTYEWKGPKQPMIKVKVFKYNQFGNVEPVQTCKIVLKRKKEVLKEENSWSLLWY